MTLAVRDKGGLELLIELERGGALTPTTLTLPVDISYERWEALGPLLSQIHRSAGWWIGDWLNFGEAVYGEKYAQAVDATGNALPTLMNYASVANRIPPERRRQELSYTMHRLVAWLEPAEQDYWLDKAASEGWTSRELDENLSARIDLGGLKESVHVEWYTPADYIEAARLVLGTIDLDPASNDMANEVVKATTYYTEADNGLEQPWSGCVWLNPPYGKGSGLFTTKLIAEYGAGNVSAAILLLNAYGFDSQWFQPLWNHLICFTDHRIVFYSPDHESGGPANANIFVYLGPDEQRFVDEFSRFGAIVRRIA